LDVFALKNEVRFAAGEEFGLSTFWYCVDLVWLKFDGLA